MKKLLVPMLAAAIAVVGTMGVAHAQDKLRLQLKWVTQAQFAGYIVAKAKGFYTEENLDVSILPLSLIHIPSPRDTERSRMPSSA